MVGPVIVTRFYWWPEERMWLFMVTAGDDDVLATGSEPDLETAALRARRALERWRKQ
jgi:hypothetical protein